MKEPIARPVSGPDNAPDETARGPRAFEATAAEATVDVFTVPELESIPALPRRRSPLLRVAVWAGGLLVSLGLGLAAERLIRDLFARYEWLGWLGMAALALLVLALVLFIAREILALRRLRSLNQLRRRSQDALLDNDRDRGAWVVGELQAIYADRPDLARQRHLLQSETGEMFDGAEMVRFAERTLMAPLDARARGLTAGSARRVALVTAVSPRALIDVAFVIYESVRLAGAIAALYGARPGFFGSWRLAGAILAHLAVTGGLVLTDGLVEQLVGQGLAARLSARLGEGVVNGLMTVRVGIAAMRVVRPLTFSTQAQPTVRDFLPELVNLAKQADNRPQ